MYKILTIHDKVRVPPIKFKLPRDNAIKSSLEDRWEGLIDRKLGVILAVLSVGDVGEGTILLGDGAIYYPVDFNVLVYSPEIHELVKGYVIDVTEFGVFVRIGPLDGMIHVSQIMDDFVTYDPKNSVFVGRESKNILKEKDIVRARIVSISITKQYKIGLTTRQPGLGALTWIEKEKKEAKRKKAPAKTTSAKVPQKAAPKSTSLKKKILGSRK